MMSVGRLAARVVAGDDHAVGQPAATAPISGRLAGVAVAAAAEHAPQLAAARLRQRRSAGSALSSASGVWA